MLCQTFPNTIASSKPGANPSVAPFETFGIIPGAIPGSIHGSMLDVVSFSPFSRDLEPGLVLSTQRNKAQYISLTEQSSVRRTCDVDVFSPKISLIYGKLPEPGFHSFVRGCFSTFSLRQGFQRRSAGGGWITCMHGASATKVQTNPSLCNLSK